jgi:hypothetical protein
MLKQKKYHNVMVNIHIMELIKSTFLRSNIYMAIKPYKLCNTFIYKIFFDLSESTKIACFKDQFGQIIGIKVKRKNQKKSNFP